MTEEEMKYKRTVVLKELRKEKGLKQSTIADILGISLQAYQKYEYGTAEPNNTSLIRLANFYGVTTDYLLGKEESTIQEDPIVALCKAYGFGITERAIITAYCAMKPDQRKELIKNIDILSENVQKAKEISKKNSQNTQTNIPNSNQPNIPITYEEPPPPRYSYQYAARGSNWQGQTMDLTDDELEDLLLNSPEVPEDIFNK